MLGGGGKKKMMMKRASRIGPALQRREEDEASVTNKVIQGKKASCTPKDNKKTERRERLSLCDLADRDESEREGGRERGKARFDISGQENRGGLWMQVVFSQTSLRALDGDTPRTLDLDLFFLQGSRKVGNAGPGKGLEKERMEKKWGVLLTQ